LYIILFPKLIAGPIIRYHDIAEQIPDRSKTENSTERLLGFYRFCIGLGKKVLIANALAAFADSIYGNAETGLGALDPNTLSMGAAWLAALSYTFQIYFDFSGYSDMAIGLGRMVGFKFPENFNNPYVSQNITEFWRRWHMTLSRFLRDYLYIPLGGNRYGEFRRHANLTYIVISSLHDSVMYTSRDDLVHARTRKGKLVVCNVLGLRGVAKRAHVENRRAPLPHSQCRQP
jgi:alginate O-acetyltransferase complex protein AlgI